MTVLTTHHIGDHTIHIGVRDGVMTPSPYSLTLGRNIPRLDGKDVLDLGTGSGILAIIAMKQGARSVALTDSYEIALDVAWENLQLNGIRTGVTAFPAGDAFACVPVSTRFDVVICNSSQLPMSKPDREGSPYYAGADGRMMIEKLIVGAREYLRPGGTILFIQTSLVDVPTTAQMLTMLGYRHRIVARQDLEFRTFYDKAWIDNLGGTTRGLYKVIEGRAVETLNIIVAEVGQSVMGELNLTSVA